MIKVVICDDQEIVREGLRTILNADPDIDVYMTAGNGESMLSRIAGTEVPNLVLMDLKMPIMNGVQATKNLKLRYPEVKVLVLTTYDDDQWVMDAIRSGAAGYLMKDTPRMDLIDAVKGTLAGQTFIDPSVAGKIVAIAAGRKPRPAVSDTPDIRPREREILLLIARGLANVEIADKLCLSEGTVRNYASTLFTRMGVADRTQAAVTALRYGIIGLDEI